MPVLYSPLIASTAITATIAWPTWTPVRLSLAGSAWQPPPGSVRSWRPRGGALTAMVSAAAASSSQPVPASVRSLVHSACSAGESRLAHASLRRSR